jgi:ribosomal protein L24
LPIHISNVAYYLADEKTVTKIWVQFDSKGKKVRFAKKTGKVID